MPNVSNSISFSSAHCSRKEQHENSDSMGNGELTPFTAALDSVRNSTHELNKESLLGKVVGCIIQPLQWLRPKPHAQSAVENGSNEEGIPFEEVLSRGGALYRQTYQMHTCPDGGTAHRGWKGSRLERLLVRLGFATAAGLVVTGYQHYAGEASSGSQNNTLQTAYTPANNSNTSGNHGINLEDSFGHHPLHHDDPEKNTRHGRRHVDPQTPPSTLDEAESSVHVKNDYLCIEERAGLSSSGMLRTISKTLKSPFSKSAEEWQVFYKAYILGEGCPNKANLHYYEDIFFGFDYLASNILTVFPQFLPMRIAQNLIAPLLDMIADELDGKVMSLDVVEDINLEILGLTQIIMSSLDHAAKESLFYGESNQKKIDEILDLDKGKAFIKFQGGEDKYRLGLDSKGPYIHQMNKENLEYNRQYVEYSGKLNRWEVAEQPEVNVLTFPLAGEEGQADFRKQLLKQARIAVKKKYISARSFVGDVLTHSGILSEELFGKAMASELEGLPKSHYMEDINTINDSSQLKKIKAGHVLLFLSGGNQAGGEQVNHLMVSLGDGIFSGAENKILNAGNDYSGIMMAEQLGRFFKGKSGYFRTEGNKRFHLISGALKGSKVSRFTNYEDAALNLSHPSLKKPGGGISAIAEILSETGDISTTFSNYLNEELLRKSPILPKALEMGGRMEVENISNDLPIGKVICLMNHYNLNFDGAIFALRINKEEVFIPALSEPLLKNANKGAIFKIDEIKTRFKTYQIKQVEFTPENLRVPMLLGKDSSFFVKDNVLHVRAHGFPGLVNHMYADEVVNIIKSLSISKNIDLNKVTTIDLESCYGATNFPLIPSTGKAIAKIMGKKVIAYNGKYKAGIKNESQKRKIFSGQAPLHELESFVMQFAAEKSIHTVTAIRNMYDYLANVESPHSPTRGRRSVDDFNAYLLDVGRLILGKIRPASFRNKYQDLYGINKKAMFFIKTHILSPMPVSKDDFVDEFLEILSLDNTAFARLFSLFEGTEDKGEIADANKLRVAANHIHDNGRDYNGLIYKNIGGILGLSGGNKFFSPRNKSEFGEPGDVYYDNESNKYFVFKKEGIPQNHEWDYPMDGMDDEVWIYAGTHPGSLIEPKGWSEYGKAGSIYYGRDEGYHVARYEGRPSDHNWYYPSDGAPNEYFYPIGVDIGDFRMPHSPVKSGNKGSVYLFGKHYYILRKTLKNRPSTSIYPRKSEDNEYWIYAGEHAGTIQDPKKWDEYGKPGCIYHDEDLGFFMLKVEGKPSDNKWNFPEDNLSNKAWQFIAQEIGTINSPKLFDVEGMAGEVYFDLSRNMYFILRKDGKPSRNNWQYPAAGEDNDFWLHIDKNAKSYFYNDLV